MNLPAGPIAAWLIIDHPAHGRREVPLPADYPLSIGNSDVADVEVRDPVFARRQFLFEHRDGGNWIRQTSINQPVINGQAIEAREPKRLADGDVIELGETRIRHVLSK